MRKIFTFLAIIFTLSIVAAGTTELVLHFQFKIGCRDYLKLAGDAPNIKKSTNFLEQALDYMEKKELTKGNSAYFIRTPRNDVGIWYEQIKGAYETVNELLEQEKNNPGSVAQLTKDNALMKVREVVLDDGEKGTTVTLPQNIRVYPSQLLFLFWYLLSLIFAIICWIGVAFTDSY